MNRSASALRAAIPALPLPDGTMQLSIPRVNATVGVVATQENLSPSDDYTPNAGGTNTDSLTVPVRCFEVEAPIAQQLWDRSDIDQVLALDMAEEYVGGFGGLEYQILNGAGTGGQFTGLLSVSNSTPISYTSASPTTAAFTQACGQAVAAVGNGRKRPASHLIMRPGRYTWLAATADGTGNVSTMRAGLGIVPTDRDLGEWGPVAGVPVLQAPWIPSNLGGGSNQDTVIAWRAQDQLLLEAAPIFDCTPETLAGQLTAVVRCRVYAAFFPHRRPLGLAVINGTGLVVAAGF